MAAATPDPAAHESLTGVLRICDRCWHPIEEWGQLSWRRIGPNDWIFLHTACLLAGTDTETAS
jgi:hypothetical protein